MKIQRLNCSGRPEPIEDVSDAEGHRLVCGGAARVIEYGTSASNPVTMNPVDAPAGLPVAEDTTQRIEVVHKFEEPNDA